MDESLLIAPGAALSAFGFDAQHNRLLRLAFPYEDGPPATMLPNRLVAREEVSRGFRFDIEVLSDDAHIPLKMLMGRMVTVSLVRQDGSLRHFNGYITEFRYVRTDGGFAFYRMLLEPWLAFTRLRKDCRSFHNKSVREITEETLKHYHQADWHMHIFDEDPRQTLANQFNETDANHLHRRWEGLGLHYWYEHRFDGHTLMLSDKTFQCEPIDATCHDDADVIPFRSDSGSRDEDGIRSWTAIRRLGSGKTTLTSFNYKQPGGQHASVESSNQQGDFYPYERYEDTGSYGFRMRSDGEQLAARRMVEQDKDTQYFEAEGNDRNVLPGRTFRLGGHVSAEPRSCQYDPEPRPGIGDRNYLILTVEHEAANNYQAGPGAASHYENRLTCVRRDIRWRPGRGFNSEPGLYMGLHTATVVGPAGADIHTDGYGRIKLQFHWDRLGKRDENSSPWIRVMTPAAGNQFGQIRLPRVGEEVAVVYPDGNIDHPLVLGAMYNGAHMPPWKLPEQAALAGVRSRELGGGTRGNHLVFDDTQGKIQVQLKSDHQCSQLSLGQITRIEDTNGRKDARGEGWELRTDGHGVARAADGLMITTEARSAASGSVKEVSEPLSRLKIATLQYKTLASLAQENGIQTMAGRQEEISAALNEQVEAINGSNSEKTDFPQINKPLLILSSSAGIAASTVKDVHISSERHTALTSGKDFIFSAGSNFFLNVKHSIQIFIQKFGLKMVAAAGDIDIQAIKNNIRLLAKLDISQSGNRIIISAKEEVILNGGGSYARFSAGSIEIGTNGSFVSHASNHNFLESKNLPLETLTAATKFGSSTESEQILSELTATPTWVEFKLIDDNGPVADEPYVLTAPDGSIHEGIVDKNGSARIDQIPAGICKIDFPAIKHTITAIVH